MRRAILERAVAKTWSDDLPEGPASADPPPDAARLDPPADRYELLGLLGQGGGGEVLRALDRHLDRVVALKRQTDLSAEGAQRFEAEAQAHAQLQHPNIAAVHDLDRDEDGRWFFTMPEVRGRTLDAAISAVHAVSGVQGWRRTEDGWGLERLLDALVQVGDAVAAAHASGVLHRDLKPTNIMLGPNGEVLVLDWGLARLTPGSAVATRARLATLHGHISGTPAYMAPEMARGQPERVGPHTDVYGLGAVLYQILSGRPPHVGDDPLAVLLEVMAGPPLPPGYAGGDPELDALLEAPPSPGPPVPAPLSDLCLRALETDPARRPASAAAFTATLRGWLEGAGRHERALAHLESAAARELEAAAARELADRRRAEAAEQVRTLPSWADETAHAPIWALEDEAREAHARAEAADRAAEQHQHEAEQEAPEAPEVHAARIGSALQALTRAEASADDTAATRAILRLERHRASLPATHPAHARATHALRGDGTLTLWTEPPGAEVWLETFTLSHRRLTPRPVGLLGRTPLVGVPLPMGSHRLVLRLAGHHDVIYPVHLARNGDWSGTPPGADAPFPIPLPPLGSLGPDEIYVPAGPFLAGGDPEQDRLPPLALWCDGFVIDRLATTFGQWLEFLNDRVGQGDPEAAARWEPRYYGAGPATEAEIFRRRPDGRYEIPFRPPELLQPGETNIRANMPVINVSRDGAAAYACWRAAREGQPWRLPGELEREKAGRGVDGRTYPMGPHLDPSWTWIRDSLGDTFELRDVDALPDDLSVYAVMGLAGNVRCWCADAGAPQPPRGHAGRVPPPPDPPPPGPQVSRGGAWASQVRASRCAFRVVEVEGIHHSLTGVRLLRPYGPRAPGARDV